MSEIDIPIEINEISDSKEFDKNVKNARMDSEWLTKFESNTLSESDFQNYWNIWVPRIFKPKFQNNYEWSSIKISAEQILFISLEEFICSGNGIEVLRGLTQQNYPTSVCGRVFKMGEPSYNCRECEMDSTCVLCTDCFKQSSHKNHKYKMGTSYAGGCCDCGDIEAWKQDAYCQTHMLGLEKKHVNLNLITDDMEKRAHLVFQSILRYARTLLDTTTIDCVENDLDPDLQCIYNNPDDNFCTVIYNDETRTFNQLLTILCRVIKCPLQECIDYATSIVRKGRAVVKCDSCVQCENLKEEIEKFTSRFGIQPLKMAVVHSHVITHQIYALRLLTWMQNLLGYSDRLRAVFSNYILGNNTTEGCIIESILQKDTAIWMSAKQHWHKLFITGMFIEYENKKNFAKVFTNNYGIIINNFINDDHDCTYSVALLGVQIFTVPTLANYLMTHRDVLYQFLNTFLSECPRYINKRGKLEFERKNSNLPFLRSLRVFGDICYLLGCVPETWNSDLRVSFCHAVSLFLRILNYMQNMDTVSRQAEQIEYQPDWETTFIFHVKLRSLTTKILLWCGSDRIVLKEVYRMTLKEIWENPVLDPQRPNVVKELNKFKVNCVNYDVSTEPVSIHLPLSRFLARLYLYLDRYGLSYIHSKLQIAKQSPEQVIEPALRALVLISQVRAGMWEITEDSYLIKIHLYHNSRYRIELLNNDIITLQIGASLIDSNEFLIHVLNKFNLVEWAQSNFELKLLNYLEETIQQTICLVEEFLTLIIYIVGERYTPGVGKVTFDDYIKKEVIQRLCIKRMPHSELKKTLLSIIEDEECLEKVINEVAVFKKTKGKGVYELKPIYYDDYNVFFYHYTREEMSESEEEQRKRRKAAGELEFCPPPCLPLFSDTFSKIANIFQCDVMLYIMKLILDRSVNLRSRSFSESQLHKVLHLIGYALYEEEKQQSPTFTFTACSEPYGIEAALDELKRSARIEDHKDLVIWTLNKFRQVSASRRKSEEKVEVKDTEDVKNGDAKEEKQKKAKFLSDRRAAIMAQIAQKQNNFMKDNAMLFENTPTYSEPHIDSTSKDILENIGEFSVALGPYQTSSSSLSSRYTCIMCQEEQLVTLDGHAMVLATFVHKSSVLCQERSSSENFNDITTDPYYIPANFGPSPHISTCGHVMHVACWKKRFDKILANENRTHDRFENTLTFNMHKIEYRCPLCDGLCNTIMPLLPSISCFTEPENMKKFEKLTFQNWLEGLNMALKQSNVAKPKNSENTIVKESVLDSIQTTSSEPQQQQTPIRRDLREIREIALIEQAAVVAEIYIGNKTDQVVATQNNNEKAQDKEDDEIEVLPPTNQFSIGTNDFIMQILMFDKSSRNDVPKVPVYKNSELSTSLVDTILKFAHGTYSKATDKTNSLPDDNQIPLMIWKACAYTIHSNEVIIRYKNKPLLGEFSCGQRDCLEALVRVSGILSSTWKKEHEINLHTLRILSLAIDNGGNNSIGILDWDAFGMLVSLTMTLPSLYYTEVPIPAPRGTMLDFHTLLLMFIAHLVQIILTIEIEENSEEMLEMDPEEEDTSCIADLVYKLRGISIKNTVAVWNMVKNCALPFLRCCSLFYHFLTGVPASGNLTKFNGDTYHNMCCYLGLPNTCKDVLNKPYVEMLINKWTENEKLVKIRQGEKIPFKVWTHISELVQLPDDYIELLNMVSIFTCPNSDQEDPKSPAMCLMCGKILCSECFCCQTEVKREPVGACSGHAYSCGFGFGIFLRVRECDIVLLDTLNKGTFFLSPYLDEYGETDAGLKRGNPLYLCKEKYRNLQLLWLGHELHKELSRKPDSTSDRWHDM